MSTIRTAPVGTGAAQSLAATKHLDGPILGDSDALRPGLAVSQVDATAAPCRRCGHPLSAPESVARLLGPVCLLVVGRGGSDV